MNLTLMRRNTVQSFEMSDCDRDNLIFKLVCEGLARRSVKDLEDFYMEQMTDWYNDWSDEELEALK